MNFSFKAARCPQKLEQIAFGRPFSVAKVRQKVINCPISKVKVLYNSLRFAYLLRDRAAGAADAAADVGHIQHHRL